MEGRTLSLNVGERAAEIQNNMCFSFYSLFLARGTRKYKLRKESVYLYEDIKVNRNSNLGL